jgi:hypothetical protein
MREIFPDRMDLEISYDNILPKGNVDPNEIAGA